MKNLPKLDQKTPNKDLQNASSNFTLFLSHPETPKNVKTPAPWGISRGGSAAPARPRVAKARISCHHYKATASPDLSAYAQQPARGPTMGAVAADVGVVVSCRDQDWLLWFVVVVVVVFVVVVVAVAVAVGVVVAVVVL